MISLRGVSVALGLALAIPGPVAAQTPPSVTPPAKASPSAPAPQVERQLLEAVRLHPESFEAHRAVAAFYLKRGRLEQALPHLQQAQTIEPSHYANGYDLALVLLQTGKVAEARDQVARTVAVKDSAELHNLLGDIEERAGNLVAAAEEYQRAAHMDATEENLFDWGNNLLQLGAYEPATEVFTAAIERQPKSVRLRVGLGIALYSRGQYDGAVTSFCKAADLAPSDPRPYRFLGEMYGVAPERAAEITARVARFVELRPRNAEANLYYALNLWKGQPAGSKPADLAKVEALLRRSVALDPKLAKGYLQLGILLSDERRYKEAIVSLRQSSRLEPNEPQAHYRLSQAYQRTGQDALAATELEIFERLKGTAGK